MARVATPSASSSVNRQVLVARHGETDWTLGDANGDQGLNRKGRQQVRDTRQRWPMTEPVLMISSTLRRARETAQLWVDHLPDGVVEPDLKDWLHRAGQSPGNAWLQFSALNERQYERETREAFQERVMKFSQTFGPWVNSMSASYATIVIVCHQGVLRLLHDPPFRRFAFGEARLWRQPHGPEKKQE